MQYNSAQTAANEFFSFTFDPWDYYPKIDQEEADLQEWQQKLEFVSDFLELWLLTGRAHEACIGKFGIYAHAVSLIFAELDAHPTFYPGADRIPFLPPTPPQFRGPSIEVEGDFVVAPSFVLPGSLTRERFKETALYSPKQRRYRIKQFLANPWVFRHGPGH